MTNATQTFQIIVEDGYARPHRLTFKRASRGQFPTMTKVEREQNNGRETYWTMHRASCHGELSNHLKIEIKKASEMVRLAP